LWGQAWYESLGAARVTLGTESGASIWDYDWKHRTMEIIRSRQFPDETWDCRYRRCGFEKYENNGPDMRQISPKIFEAIKLRTGLVLYPGEYSGILRPDRHYIPLDLSNVREVVKKIKSNTLLEAMTSVAYDDLIASHAFDYSVLTSKLAQAVAQFQSAASQ
jgi:hypothetical protein